MARPLTLKFFRGEIIKKKLAALPDDLREPVRRAVANAGDIIIERAKMLVPVDEGVLRDSIRWEFLPAEEGRFRAVIVVGPSGEFLKAHGRIPSLARWVEFGTAPATKGQRGVRFAKGGRLRQTENVSTRTHQGMPARPYLFPAWRQVKKQVRLMISAAVNRVLKAAAKKD